MRDGVVRRPWPSHLGPRRAFMRNKRKAIKRVLVALSDVQMGCAFLPDKGVERVTDIRVRLKELYETVRRA